MLAWSRGERNGKKKAEAKKCELVYKYALTLVATVFQSSFCSLMLELDLIGQNPTSETARKLSLSLSR